MYKQKLARLATVIQPATASPTRKWVWGSAGLLAACYGAWEYSSSETSVSKRLLSALAETKPFLTKGSWSHSTDPAVTHGVYDVCVIGGGIIGLATARALSQSYPDKTIAVLEKEKGLAGHQTGHNSGVIHAGIYYAVGSTMAQCCVDGAKMLYDYCEKKGLPCEKVGKLIVARDMSEYPVLEELLARGQMNGVEGLEVLDGPAMKKLEPNIDGYAALHSPNTGIVDFAEVARSFARDISTTGRGDIICNFQVSDFDMGKLGEDGFVTVYGHEPGQPGPKKVLKAKNVITCCGLNSDKIALKGGGTKRHRVTPFRGRYYQMTPDQKDIVTRNIYPVPNKSGIAVGIHFSPTIDNERGRQMIVGPGACIAFSREGYRMRDINFYDIFVSMGSWGLWQFTRKNFTMSFGELYRDFRFSKFYEEAKRLVPGLTPSMMERSFSGVMAQVFEEDGTAAKDFIFELNDTGNMIHVRNAPSPGCTACMAIAKHIVAKASSEFKWDGETPTKAEQ
eukprot:GHVN01003746.1.p1 GENE.GHVN01003746.1~~GHVN01003746.1.p1  ORF type:complete len:507 (-),score=37.70 GHVN01003746.1:984-2504(-)